MTGCCDQRQEGTNKFFTRWSKTYARRFRKGKLEKEQRLLLEGIRKLPVAGQELLDIGCGVGALHLTLLKEGAVKSTGIDMAEGMLEKARQFSEQFGLAGKTQYMNGDFVGIAESVDAADITMLDKVVCCYEDVKTLVDKSTSKTRKVYALSHPREIFFVKATFKMQIVISKLFKAKFYPFWHDWQEMHRMIASRGFELLYQNSTLTWNIAVYKRV